MRDRLLSPTLSLSEALSGDQEPAANPMSRPPQRSGYLSEQSILSSALDPDESVDDMDNDSLSDGGYSPPAWRRLGNGERDAGFWRQSESMHIRSPNAQGSSASSPSWPEMDRENDNFVLEQAMRTRLPTGSLSPDKGRSPAPDMGRRDEDDTLREPIKNESTSPTKDEFGHEPYESITAPLIRRPSDNYIRFAVRADIQHRTEPFESALGFIRSKVTMITGSWWRKTLAALVVWLAISAVRSPVSPGPVPDLVKVAGLARSFEPLIYYSEHGVSQVNDLEATGMAVWDLGESVKLSNMTSAPLIVNSLDDLSESLKTLATELTKFFANVDGDVDGILNVMDWSRRELTRIQSLPNPPLSTAFSNLHSVLSRAGLLENPNTGAPTTLGSITTEVFGTPQSKQTRSTLQMTFNEFLGVLEEAIENEIQHSLAIFGLFEAIDRQFLNLARIAIRETTIQDEQHADDLSSLWTRILGPKASHVKKYERNRELLQNVREKTVKNKGLLVEHNSKLLIMKANLESLRRRLFSAWVRSVNSSTITLDEQIRGLEDVETYLKRVRQAQKGKIMERLVGGGSARSIDEGADS